MAKSSPLTGKIMVRMPASMEAEIRKIAAARKPPIEAADLIREVAQAIIDCFHRYGSIPKDLEVVQAKWAPSAEQADEHSPFQPHAPPTACPPKGSPGRSLPDVG